MTRRKLEKQFTSMMVMTGNALAYENLCEKYVVYNERFQLLAPEEMVEKFNALRNGDPKEWITKIFTEGLQITPALYQANSLWLKHLEEIDWV